MVVPHPTNKLEIEFLTTAFRHIRPGSLPVNKKSFHYAPEAQHARHVQEHDRVALLESELECAGVVAVHYPRIPVDEFGDSLDPFIGLGLYPARAPVTLVEMVYFQIEQFTQPSRNRRLA